MRRLLALTVAAVAVVHGAPSRAQEFQWSIMTGSPSGTYIRFGHDIAELTARCGRTLTVVESAGSLENFLGVRQRRFTQFGIVQSDVLEYLKTYEADDPAIARAIHGVEIAFPLYNEEVHVLARADIPDLAALAGQRVSVGPEDSGTFLTASLVLDFAEVEAERVTLGPRESLDALIAGEIDAFFYVAGAPASLFEDPRITAEEHRLLALDHPRLQAVYQSAELPAETYPWQAEPVDLVAVKAVLMTFGYDPLRNVYHRLSCRAVSEVSHLIAANFTALQESGHPKWRDVDLNEIPPGWSIGGCVNAGLDPGYEPECRPDSAAATEDESPANAIYRQRICAAIGC